MLYKKQVCLRLAVKTALLCSLGFTGAIYAKETTNDVQTILAESSNFQHTTTPEANWNQCGKTAIRPYVTAGPQSPRDIDLTDGTNGTLFKAAPKTDKMNLCDIHFHWNAEHKSAAYSTAVDTNNEHAGWAIVEPESLDPEVRAANDISHLLEGEAHEIGVMVGDTVEIHRVYTSCDVEYDLLNPENGLGNCSTNVCANPQLRVVAQVFEVVEDDAEVTSLEEPVDIDDGDAVEYIGSTTGPGFNNNHCSPFQVTWQVSKEATTLDAHAFAHWSHEHNQHAHGVRTLVTPEGLLSKIRDHHDDD